MCDVADGLDYLHSMQPRIIHGDLKAVSGHLPKHISCQTFVQVNVLVTDWHRACLAGFGLSTASDSQVLNISSLSTRHAGGTLRWTSPELLEGVQPINTSSSDMYSFACVSYEVFCVLVAPPPTSHSINYQIFSGLIPFDKMHDHAVSLQVIRGQRPFRPSICEPWKIPCEDLGLDDETWATIEDCWKTEPEKRPTAKEVCASLSAKIGHTRPPSFHPNDVQSTLSVRKRAGEGQQELEATGRTQDEALDVNVVCARLFMLLQSPESFKKLLCLQGHQAQEIIDLLQEVRLVFWVPHRVHLACLYNYRW